MAICSFVGFHLPDTGDPAAPSLTTAIGTSGVPLVLSPSMIIAGITCAIASQKLNLINGVLFTGGSSKAGLYFDVVGIFNETGEIERDREEIEKKNDDPDHLQVSKRLQPWTKQITIRGVIASIIVGSIYTVIGMKLNLTTRMTPNLNVSAALLGFKSRIFTVPFTRHENTMTQTCSVASYTIAIKGGFGSHLLDLNKKTYKMAGGANSPGTYKELCVGWMTGYSFLICFAGLFVLIPLRKEANQGVCQVLFSQFLVGNLLVENVDLLNSLLSDWKLIRTHKGLFGEMGEQDVERLLWLYI
ncbi:Oligopeptide transporter OPT superfamily [Cynara cardunculus var. scolymus]|uniref:Oligopeptide transporter OPT superfamily n=1 Tax=Cynara cardunculus var. scolymus TaxID=59895 RepID=A0A103XZ57_CYNCS|nr:Oligopeptide transporter OPT superfamily [Cynara cardunculus var. scolymus]